jgi:hypothetical protein
MVAVMAEVSVILQWLVVVPEVVAQGILLILQQQLEQQVKAIAEAMH